MKKYLVKKLIAGSLVATMAFSMVGCGGSGEDTSTKTPEVATVEDLDGKKISFLTSQGKFFEEYNAMADAMKEKYGCEVEFQVVPDNEYYSLLKVKLSTAEVPDVFEYNYPTHNEELGVAKYCEDLSNESWVDKLINPELVKDKVDGKHYALPKESSSTYMAVYYNKDVLSKCGIEDPHPTTYDEFIGMLDTVKEKAPDVTPLYMTNADTWTTQIFMTAGIPVTLGDRAQDVYDSILSNKSKFTDEPAFTKVLGQFIDLIEGGYVNKDHLSAGYDTAAEKLGTGQVAMYLTIEGCVVDALSKYPDANLGSFVIPFNDTDKLPTGAYVQGLFVPSEGKQVGIAKAFLEAWSSPEIQNIYYETKPGFPALNDTDGGDSAECIQSLVDEYIATGNYVYELNDQMALATPIWPELWNFYIEAASGLKTPEEVFETFQKQYVDYMQQQGVEGF